MSVYLLNIDREVFSSFAFHGAILSAKMLVMPMMVSYQRQTKKVFANPEDAKAAGGIVDLNNDHVERVRRCQLNDVEGIYLHWFISGLYMCTKPEALIARRIFALYSASRIAHTIVYVGQIPQPARGITWFLGYFADIYMALKVGMYFYRNL